MNFEGFSGNAENVVMSTPALSEPDVIETCHSDFHVELLCCDGVDQVEAMSMEIFTTSTASPNKECFARDDEVGEAAAESPGTISKHSNVFARDLVVMGQGRDLLPESLGPGVKLGPLATTSGVSSRSASNAEKVDPNELNSSSIDVPKKCEKSARIWELIVLNAEGTRCSFK